MHILIITYSITRSAGGVFDAVRDLFVNSAFTNHHLKIFSFIDEHIVEDISSWNDIPMKMFSPLALSSTSDDIMEET